MRRLSLHRAAISRSFMLAVSVACLLLLNDGAWSAESAKKIVLIGGPASHGVGEHDFSNGIMLLKQFFASSPDARAANSVAYPARWPIEASALDGAATLLLYFDGVE